MTGGFSSRDYHNLLILVKEVSTKNTHNNTWERMNVENANVFKQTLLVNHLLVTTNNLNKYMNMNKLFTFPCLRKLTGARKEGDTQDFSLARASSLVRTHAPFFSFSRRFRNKVTERLLCYTLFACLKFCPFSWLVALSVAHQVFDSVFITVH